MFKAYICGATVLLRSTMRCIRDFIREIQRGKLMKSLQVDLLDTYCSIDIVAFFFLWLLC